MNFLGIFWVQNDCLVVGPWQLFKDGDRQGILADFVMPFFKLWPGADFFDIFCVIGYLMGKEIF